MAYTHHGAGTGSFTHAHHWLFSVAIIQPSTGCFVSANAKQAGHAFGDRERILGTTATCLAAEVTIQERFLMEWIPESECVALRAYHSNYLSAPEDGLVHANQASKTMFEHWKLIDVGGDADGDGGAGTILIGLQSAHGTYLNVDEAGNCILATEPHGFLFLLNIKMGDTGAQIRNPILQCLGILPGAHHPVIPCALIASHENFLTEDSAAGLHCNKLPETDNDVFFIEVITGEKVVLRTPAGRFLATDAKGNMALLPSITTDCHFLLGTVIDGRACLQSIHKRYLAAEPSGRVVCNRASPGIWEAFNVLAGPRGGERAKDVHRGATINFVVVTDHHLTGME